jgi:hypothetical protein
MEHNNDREWLDELLERKSYNELSLSEKERVLKEIGSEEQYKVLRKVSQALVTYKADLSPDPQTIEALKVQLARRHRKENVLQRVIGYYLPGYAAAAMIVIAVISTWYVTSLTKSEPARSGPVTLVRSDTVYVLEKPDTVFVERVIYRDRVLPPRETYQVVKSPTQERESGSGVSMKEKEELENLLVSGS